MRHRACQAQPLRPSVVLLDRITAFECYRGTSLIRNSTPLEPYSRNMPRALRWSQGGGLFLMSEVPLCMNAGFRGGSTFTWRPKPVTLRTHKIDNRKTKTSLKRCIRMQIFAVVRRVRGALRPRLPLDLQRRWRRQHRCVHL